MDSELVRVVVVVIEEVGVVVVVSEEVKVLVVVTDVVGVVSLHGPIPLAGRTNAS